MNFTKNISLTDIKENPYQPRTQFDQQQLAELADSIKNNGLIQPVIVRKKSNGYEIIAGERRCRASALAGLKQVPCLVISADDTQAARLALVENIQRQNLNSIDEAKAYVQLLKMDNCTQNQLAQKVGKQQSTIANKIRLLNLNPEVQEALCEGKITERQARALLAIPGNKQNNIYKKIVDQNLDSAATEKYVNNLVNKKPTSKAAPQTNKIFLRDARIALNTINQAVKQIKSTKLEVEEDTQENEDGYILTIRIKKIK